MASRGIVRALLPQALDASAHHCLVEMQRPEPQNALLDIVLVELESSGNVAGGGACACVAPGAEFVAAHPAIGGPRPAGNVEPPAQGPH